MLTFVKMSSIMPFSLKLRRFWLRLTQYEYWHWLSLYILILPYLLWLSIRAKSFRYFLQINPGFDRGGFQHYSKKAVLDLIPEMYKPQTFLVGATDDFFNMIEKTALPFPIIAKPDMGERGKGVVKLNSLEEARYFSKSIDCKYIIQNFIDYPIEIGVFYSRLPSEQKGKVSSVTLKEFLHIIGDGKSTVKSLIEQNDRALFQYEKLQIRYAEIWNTIIPENERMELEPIGNHNKGTRFINANYLINPDLEAVIEKISRQIPGFQYGRYDLRVSSLADLYEGKNILIMELNGTNSEPTHIYDGSVGLFRALRDLAWHWRKMAQICRENSEINQKTSENFLSEKTNSLSL
jgi:hypothetical protein